MKYEKITKHEALKKATELCGGSSNTRKRALSKTAILTKYYQNTIHAMSHGKKGKIYCEQRGLDYNKLNIGFCGMKLARHGVRSFKLVQKSLASTRSKTVSSSR